MSDAADHERRISSLEQRDAITASRIIKIEEWQNSQKTFAAVRTERDKHMDKRFDKIESDVGEIKGYLLKIVWVIVVAVLGGLMSILLNGGQILG